MYVKLRVLYFQLPEYNSLKQKKCKTLLIKRKYILVKIGDDHYYQ
jgi:hypothetical protein